MMMSKLPSATISDFRKALLDWYQPDARPLPWKAIRNPYFIWLSEIILQQTRVEQGLPYYQRFTATYPTVEALATAPLDDVLKLWEGLGYYSRARNLHKAAQVVTKDWQGQFPDTYEGLLSLPGVGPYTAAAISSFAFGLPQAVVDGNVYRVLSRFLGWDIPIDSSQGKKQFAAAAQQLIVPEQAALYNQAIMDFGATLCTPKQAACHRCPLATRCLAKQQDRVYHYPVKAKKLVKRDRFFHYLILESQGHVLLQQRTAGDIWQGLYEFPLYEATLADLSQADLAATPVFTDLAAAFSPRLRQKSAPMRQVLTHQRIVVVFWHFDLKKLPEGTGLISPESKLGTYAFPRVIRQYLDSPPATPNLF